MSSASNDLVIIKRLSFNYLRNANQSLINVSSLKPIDLNESELKRLFKFNSDLLYSLTQFVWCHILPLICLVGTCTNFLNIKIFARPEFKHSIYKYFLIYSMADFVYTLISFVYFFAKYGPLTRFYSTHSSYFLKFYELYIFQLVTLVLGTFLMLIALSISVKRLLLFGDYMIGRFKASLKVVCVVSFVVSLLCYVTYPFSRSIVELDDSKILNNPLNRSTTKAFALVHNRFYNCMFYRVSTLIVSLIRGLLMPLILLVLNVIMSIKLVKQMRRKNCLKFPIQNESK